MKWTESQIVEPCVDMFVVDKKSLGFPLPNEIGRIAYIGASTIHIAPLKIPGARYAVKRNDFHKHWIIIGKPYEQ